MSKSVKRNAEILYKVLPEEFDGFKNYLGLYIEDTIDLDELKSISLFKSTYSTNRELFETLIDNYNNNLLSKIRPNYEQAIIKTIDDLNMKILRDAESNTDKVPVKFARVKIKGNGGMSEFHSKLNYAEIEEVINSIYVDKNKTDYLIKGIQSYLEERGLGALGKEYWVAIKLGSNKKLAIEITHDSKRFQESSGYNFYFSLTLEQVVESLIRIGYIDDGVDKMIEIDNEDGMIF